MKRQTFWSLLAGPALLGSRSPLAADILYSVTDLGLLPGYSMSEGLGLNNAGQITGYSSITTGAPHAFLYSNGQMSDLGTLEGMGAAADAINSSSQVVGPWV